MEAMWENATHQSREATSRGEETQACVFHPLHLPLPT